VFAARALVMMVAVALFAGTGVFSQEKKDSVTKDTGKDTGTGTGKIKGVLPAHWSKLGLTDQQKQDVYKARAKFQDQIKKLQDQLDALKSEERKELEKILTAEQKKRLVELLVGETPAK